MWNTSSNDCQLYLDPSKFQKPYGYTEKDMEQFLLNISRTIARQSNLLHKVKSSLF